MTLVLTVPNGQEGQLVGVATTAQSVVQCLVADAGGSGGTVAPLSNVLYVDRDTLVLPADQNGSIAAPFDQISDALAALPGALGNGLTVIICPGDYSSEPPLVLDNNASYAFCNAAGHWMYPSEGSTIGNLDNFVVLPALQLGGAPTFANVNAQGCAINGGVDVGSAGVLQLFACAVDSCALNAGSLNAFDSLLASVTLTADRYCNLDRCEVSTTTIAIATAATVDVSNSVLEMSLSVTFSGPAGVLNVDARSNYFWNLLPGSLVNGSKTVQNDIT